MAQEVPEGQTFEAVHDEIGTPIPGETLGEVLLKRVESNTGEIYFHSGEHLVESWSMRDLLARALRVAGGLSNAGVSANQEVVIQCMANTEFLAVFWGAMLIGAIPVPLAYAPLGTGAAVDLEAKLRGVYSSLRNPIVVYDEAPPGAAQDTDGFRSLTLAELRASAIELPLDQVKCGEPDGIAFIQFSSGSTGAPKGVTLTHHNLLANIRAIGRGIALTERDKVVGWMPLHHDMGLIGFHLTVLAHGATLINISPISFVRRPHLWLELMATYRATVSGAPNFGYQLALRRVSDEQIAALDLSHVRVLLNGAEPISARVVDEFCTRFALSGLRRSAMFPVYGMAEASLAVAFPPLGDVPIIRRASRKAIAESRRVELASDQEDDAVELVGVGQAVNDCQLRIVDDSGIAVDAGQIGQIEIRGRNVTRGYYDNDAANAEIFRDGWLNTGDLGVQFDGSLYVTGRAKDIIFINGCNYFSFDIEQCVEALRPELMSQVAASAVFDHSQARDVVLLFVAGKSGEDLKVLREIRGAVAQRTGVPIDYFVRAKRLPKTTSGKIQRQRLSQAFLNGELRAQTVSAAELVAAEFECPTAQQDACDTEIWVRQLWATVLSREATTIPLDAPFRSLGGTSLMAVDLLSRIEHGMGHKFGHDLLLRCSTVAQTAEYLDKRRDGTAIRAAAERLCRERGQAECCATGEPELARPINGEDPHGANDIAIIGIDARLPGARSLDDFWEGLRQGHVYIDTPPRERPFVHSRDIDWCKQRAGYLSDVYHFDAAFFGIEEAVAAGLDPQQRLVLEVALNTLLSAGYAWQRTAGSRVGLYLGASHNAYSEHYVRTQMQAELDQFPEVRELSQERYLEFEQRYNQRFGRVEFGPESAVNNLLNMIAARVSHFFDWKGPSLVVDTACSSSLVATHLACESLRRGECEMALTGGVNLLLSPMPFLLFSKAGVLSPDGVCRVFDERAAGMVPGEGVVLYLLKRLEDAQRDGDRVLAVIKASAMNNDGQSLSLMAPNPDAQQLVIQTVYEKSGIDPRSVGYIEAHGTGTALGDPSEVRALTGAFERFTSEKGFCAIASVKANIGHLLSAAGAAGVLRAVLTLRKGELAPSAELQVENHLIGFDQTPFKPVRKLRPWPRLSYPRRAAVNSFGFGGTNCHLLLEEAPSSIPTGSLLGSADRVLLRVSAHSQSALLARRRDTADWLERYPEHDIADVCYSINQSSTAFPVRCSIVASDRAGLLESLRSRPAKEFPRVERKPRVALLLTGQGSQYPHMARDLYRTCSPFRRYFDEVAGVFDRVLPEPLTETVFGERATVESMAATLITQLSVFAVDYSLGHMLLDFGLEPAFVLGHSVGEYAAACLADVFDLSTCAQALIARASGMQALPSDGGMAAVFAKELQVDQLIDATGGAVCVAGYNGSHQVVSGALNDIEEFARRAAEVGITVRRLTVSHAFHSPLMRPMLDNFARALAGLQCALPRIPLISNVSAQPLTAEPGVQYWLDHVLSPVRFAESIRYARSEGVSVFVEAGPDRVLSTMAQAALSDASDGATFISLLGRKSNDWKAVLEGLGRLHEAGVDLEWNAVEGRSARVLVDVPTYPFERKEFSPLPRPNPLAEVFYRWSWKEFEPDTASGDDSDVLPDGPILCISEELQHAELLRAAMDTRGVQVAHISARQATPSLLRAVSSVQAGTPAACIFWLPAHDSPIGEVNACSTPDLEAERSRQDDIANILLLAKALDSLAPHGRPLRYLVVTQGADGFEEGTPSDTNAKHLQTCGCARDAWVSAAWAAVAAISKDSLKLEACAFDLGCTNANDPCLPDVAPVVRALFSKRPNPPLVAAHGSRRYVRKLEPIMLGELGNQGALGKDDTILITGGLGGVGLAIAEALADRFQVNLVLTGRTPVDQSKPTGQEAPEPSTSENDQRLAQLRRLRSLGSRVRYESVDVCDANAMAALTHSVAEEIGPITGVVHAAGTVDYSTPRLRDKTEEGIRHVLSSKISGSLVLDHVTRDQPLRFFVLFSSIAASSPEWGGGLADYAAANGFLGGLARMRKLWGRSGLSMAMHWSLWNDVGMGRDAGLQSLVRAQGLAPLSKRVALECFHHLIGLGDALPVVHILVRTPEPTRVAVRTTKGNPPAILPLAVTAAGNVAVERQQLSAAELVRACLTEVLERNIERIDLGTGFRELGLTSYSAVAMATRLSERMGRTLNPTLLFEHRNPTALIQFVDEQLRGEDGATPQPLARGCSVPPPGPGNDAVAIISAACRLPGADNVEEYWELLTKGETMIDEVKDQALLTNYFEAGETDAAKTYSKWAAHIRDPMLFDAMFFGISPREAAAMDPQQRLFLEVAWEALQSGGYGGVRPRDVGVFVGCEANHYSERFVNHQRYESLMSRLQDEPWFMRLGASERHALECLIVDVLRPSPVVSDVVAGAGLNEIAARVSHTFDLVGPSFVVNSACSSALVALHLACAGLRAGECSMAIVGGVYLNLGSTPFVFLSKLKALSPTGRCRPFDDAADGMVLGEGVGAVLLKPLTRALRDGDTIQAIIRGSALNNDGRSQGITVPNPRGQAAAIRRAYEVSGIAPQTISYVECHGTGTSLGDPIEIEGLTQAFQSFTQERQFCAVGSAKAVVGHMLAASGLAGLIKVVLSMKHQHLPGNPCLNQYNSRIDFDSTPFRPLPKSGQPWLRQQASRRAGLSAFGFGGTNAHVIIEEPPAKATVPEAMGPWLVILSERNEAALAAAANRLANAVVKQADDALATLCRSICRWHRNYRVRASGVVGTRDELLTFLRAQGQVAKATRCHATPPELVVVLGNGFSHASRFVSQLERHSLCDDGQSKVEFDAREQDAGFAAQLILGHVLGRLGIRPRTICAEGFAVRAGAVLAGRLSLEEALAGRPIPATAQSREPSGDSARDHVWCDALSLPDDLSHRPVADGAETQPAAATFSDEERKALVIGRVILVLGELDPSWRTALLAADYWIRIGNPDTDAPQQVLAAIGELWGRGIAVAVDLAYPARVGLMALPTQIFEHSRFEAPLPTPSTHVGKDQSSWKMPLPQIVANSVLDRTSNLLQSNAGTRQPIELPTLSPEARRTTHGSLVRHLGKWGLGKPDFEA